METNVLLYATKDTAPVANSRITHTRVAMSASIPGLTPTSTLRGTLYDFPPNLPLWRAQLFTLAEPITLSGVEWETYWGWIDNVGHINGNMFLNLLQQFTTIVGNGGRPGPLKMLRNKFANV